MNGSKRHISLVGYGNVGYHLFRAFEEAGIRVTHVLKRTSSPNGYDGVVCTSPDELPDDQLTIVCVPDDRVAPTIESLPSFLPVAHTSGSITLSQIPERNAPVGVFYPLQSFTRGSELDMRSVPFLIESDLPDFQNELFELARMISNRVGIMSSDERRKIHLAAVWVNNFTNHVNHVAKSYLDDQSLDFSLLYPLLDETIRKIKTQGPEVSQTGPAIRRDEGVISEHLNMLKEHNRELYTLLSRHIQYYHSNE